MMDEKYFKPKKKKPKKCSRRCVEIGVDRISELPEEVVVDILSLLPLRKAVATSVLSSRWSDSWKRTPNLKSDRISQLPDKIIILILSFLSLRMAAATSVLSSRWSDLWKHTPTLSFDSNIEVNSDIEIVNSVIQLHKAPSLKEFKISVYVNKSRQWVVAKWLEFVFSRHVERLKLDLLCSQLTDVVALEETLRYSKACRPKTLCFWKSLKRLSLGCFRVSGVAIALFLRRCPVLEQLCIHDSAFTSDDVAVCGAGLVLKHLDVYRCTGGNSVKVSAPNLTWLRVDGASKKLVLGNMPKLIRADYTFASRKSKDVKGFASGVFRSVSQLEFLNLHLSHAKAFLANGVPQMPRLKKLAISYSSVYGRGLLPITALIWASPRLQEFKLKFDHIPKDLTTWKEGIVNAQRPDHPHPHLKVFTFLGFSSRACDHIELIAYILDNCVALEKIIIGVKRLVFHGLIVDIHQEFDPQAVMDNIRQQLHGKLPDHIQLSLNQY